MHAFRKLVQSDRSERTCTLDGVDQLVLQRADGHIGPLGHVEDVSCQAPLRPSRLAHHAICERPQPSQHSAEASLPYTLGLLHLLHLQ